MKLKKKLSLKKEKIIHYKGQMIHVNSPYTLDTKKYNVGLFYDPIRGMEVFFKSIGKAKAYLDSIHFKAIYLEIEQNKITEAFLNNEDIGDAIPF